jgi:hypothetical protein
MKGMGADAFFETQPAEQPDSQTVEQSDVQTVEQPDNQTEKHSTSQTIRQPAGQTAKQPRIKATFYLQAKDIIAIDEMQTKQFKETGKKPEKSELVSEAIQLLLKQQTS